MVVYSVSIVYLGGSAWTQKESTQKNPQRRVFGLMRTKMVNLCQKDVELGRNKSKIQPLVVFLFVCFFIRSCIHYSLSKNVSSASVTPSCAPSTDTTGETATIENLGSFFRLICYVVFGQIYHCLLLFSLLDSLIQGTCGAAQGGTG